MKQVWILNHYAAKPGSVGGTRHFHLATHLRASGWNGTVIAASVGQNGREHYDCSTKSYGYESDHGVPFLWIKTPRYSGNSWKRIANILSYTGRVFLARNTKHLPKPDIIVGSSVHPFAALSAALLARRHGVPFIFEVRDLWPQTLIEFGRLPESGFVTSAFRYLERWLYQKADRIITLLPRAVDYIAPLGIEPSKVTWLPNGVDLESFPDPGANLRKDGVFTLMYFGAHGQANGLLELIHAMALVKERTDISAIRLRMIGDGPLKSMLNDMAIESGLTDRWISFEDPVSKDRIPTIASEADAFVIPVRDLPGLYKYGISMNKIFDYLAGRRPIIIATDSINNPVDEAECGITIPPGDPEALAQAILSVANMPLEQRNELGARGRRHVETKYGYDRLADQLAQLLDESVSQTRTF